MKKIIETIIGIIIMLMVLISFTRINYEHFFLKKEPTLYSVYISLLCTMIFLTGIVINNNDNEKD